MIQKMIEFLLAPLGWRRHERAVLCPAGDQLVMILVTKWAPAGPVLKCHYQGEWYGLINPVERSRLSEPSDVPVVEDASLAREIMLEGLEDA